MKKRVLQLKGIEADYQAAHDRYTALGKTRSALLEGIRRFANPRKIEVAELLKTPEQFLGKLPDDIEQLNGLLDRGG
jgi:hypothetical protein